MQMIEVSKLTPHPRNKEFFDDIVGDKWEDFKKSIVRRGVVEGIVVTQDLLIVSGHQRVRACKELGILEVPCRITHYPGIEPQTGNSKEGMILEDLISTNILQRGIGSVNPMKMAKCIVELERIYGIRQGSAGKSDKDNLGGKTQKDLAKDMSITDQQLRDYKKLTNLIPELQDLVESNQLKATTAYKIWAKMSQEEQARFFTDIGKDKVSQMTQKATKQLLEEKIILENSYNELVEEKNNTQLELEELKNNLQNKSKHVDFEFDDFYNAIRQMMVLINPFIYMDHLYKDMPESQKQDLLKQISEVENDINTLKNQIIFYRGIRND